MQNANQNPSQQVAATVIQSANPASAATPAIAQAQPVADIPSYTPEQLTVTQNDVSVLLLRTETTGKGDNAATAYWTVDIGHNGWDVQTFEVTDATGKVLATFKTQAEANTHSAKIAGSKVNDVSNKFAVWETLDTLIGHDQLLEKLQSKINQDCRVCQLVGGKDKLSMGEKLERIRDYISNGFGSERGGVTTAAYAALKRLDSEKSTILARCMEIGKAMLTAKPEQIAQLVAEMNALSAKAATLQ